MNPNAVVAHALGEPTRLFLIDPAGVDIAHFLWGAIDFAIITQPLDMTRRNDQLLVRMAAKKPPKVFMTHAAFHLPYVLMSEMPLVELGKTYDATGGLRITPLGKAREDGSVPFAASYSIQWPDGRSMLIAAPGLAASDMPAGRTDAMLLSSRHARAAEIGRAADIGLVLLDDLFLCQVRVGERRVSLASAFALQQALLPRSSVVLAPGESWTFSR